MKQERQKATVFLDVDDTILDFHKAEVKAVSETLRRLAVNPTDTIINRYSAINRSRWELLEQGKLSREQVMTSRFEILFDELGVVRSGEEAQSIYEKLLGIGHYFMPDAQKLLEVLYGKYELYIVSNGSSSIQASRLKSAGIIPYFKDVFISEEIGFEKPSPEFFRYCIDKMPVFHRERAIIVGDSLSSDILGGIRMGIKTCWYNYRAQSPRADIVADYEIRDLLELPPLLERLFAE